MKEGSYHTIREEILAGGLIMHRFALSLPTFVAAVLLSGCAQSPSSPIGADPPIQTDRAEYSAQVTDRSIELTIDLIYTNPTESKVYLPTCHGVYPPHLQKRVGDEWVVAYSPVVLLCLGPPVVIKSGEAYEYTFRVLAARPGTNTAPQFKVEEIPGTYRLVWTIYGTWTPNDGPGLGKVLPLEGRISNTFRINAD